MKYFYSSDLNTFYPLGLKSDYGDSWPKTGTLVDESVYEEFAANQPPEGKVRVAGADGMPAWADITDEGIKDTQI